MKLITSKGQLPLPEDFEFEVVHNSPFFSDEGAATIPVTIPATADALKRLGFPTRIAGRNKFIRNIKARLQAGVLHKEGQLVVGSISQSDGITASMAIAESDIYTQYKDISIRQLFIDNYCQDTLRPDFEQEADPITAWAEHIYACSAGTMTDDFTAFPVFADKKQVDNNDSYFILNEPDPNSEETPAMFMYKARIVHNGDYAEQVPLGYGITPFLYLHRFVVYLFDKMGYTVGNNFFTSSAMLRKIVLLNNTADTICTGILDYADLVPTCTVSEWIDFMEAKFNVQVFASPEGNKVDILSLDDSISGAFDIDISDIVDGEPEIRIGEPSHLVLSSDTSLDGATPPEANYKIFTEKYPIVADLDERSFRSETWRYSVIHRLSTGDYYINKKTVTTNEAIVERIGSPYFKFDRQNAKQAETRDSADLATPVVVFRKSVLTSYIVGCYIGDRIHIHTSYKSDKGEFEQKIILAFEAGISANDSFHRLKYRLGTTQKYDNLGQLWGTNNLCCEDFYFLFFTKLNKILLNCSISLVAKVNFTVNDLLNLDMSRLMLYKGTTLLPKLIQYTVGSNVNGGECEFLVAKDYSQMTTDIPLTTTPQQYRWVYRDNMAAVRDRYLNQGLFDITIEFLDNTGAPFVYIPPPTEVGVEAFAGTRPVKVWASEQMDDRVDQVWALDDVECYYESEEA